MKLVSVFVGLLMLAVTQPSFGEDAPAPAAPQPTLQPALEPKVQSEIESAAADSDATSKPPTTTVTDSQQQKSLSDILETFVPSEEIDADKPVDFPTNI